MNSSTSRAPRANARSVQTREALLAAALEVFGRDGFHAASTRAIAETAGVNQALIAYHFGSKEGLYLAVFDTINQTMEKLIGPLLTRIQAEVGLLDASQPQDRQHCMDYLDQLTGAALSMFNQPQASGWSSMVTREQQDPSDAFELMYEGIYGEMLATVTGLVAVLLEQSPEQESSRIKALTIMGQMMGFTVGRTTTLRHMDWEQIGVRELDAVRVEILASLRQYVATPG